MRRLLADFWPAMLMMALIFCLSSLPGRSLPEPAWDNLDKLVHALVYGVLAAAFLHGLGRRQSSRKPPATALLAVCLTLLYGASDELHQFFVPGRSTSLADLAADGVGAMLAAVAWYVLDKKKPAVPKREAAGCEGG